MAKIGALEVSDIKIADGALTEFTSVTGSTGTTIALTVARATPNPTELWVWAAATGTVTITRTRGAKVIAQFTPSLNMVRDMAFDADPQDGDVYTLSGVTSGSYRELSAAVRLA